MSQFILLTLDDLAESRALTSGEAAALLGTQILDITGFTEFVLVGEEPYQQYESQPIGPLLPNDSPVQIDYFGHVKAADSSFGGLSAEFPAASMPAALVVEYTASAPFTISSTAPRYVAYTSGAEWSSLEFFDSIDGILGITALKVWAAGAAPGTELGLITSMAPPAGPLELQFAADHWGFTASDPGSSFVYDSTSKASLIYSAPEELNGVVVEITVDSASVLETPGSDPRRNLVYFDTGDYAGFSFWQFGAEPGEGGNPLKGYVEISVASGTPKVRYRRDKGAWHDTDLTALQASWVWTSWAAGDWRDIQVRTQPRPSLEDLYPTEESYADLVGDTVPYQPDSWSVQNVRIFELGYPVDEGPLPFWMDRRSCREVAE